MRKYCGNEAASLRESAGHRRSPEGLPLDESAIGFAFALRGQICCDWRRSVSVMLGDRTPRIWPSSNVNVIFWQSVASPHQAPFVRELAYRLPEDSITCVFCSPLYSDLRQQGWLSPDYGSARVIYASGPTAAREIVGQQGEDTIHIFSSLYYNSFLRTAYSLARRKTALIGLLSEGRDWRGWKGFLRRIDSVRHERRWRKDVRFVLAMGGVGREWFRRCGYSAAQIIDFCYVVERPEPREDSPQDDGPLRIAYVGQLIGRKRVDLLLRALSAVRLGNWHLDIVGTGALRSKLEALCLALGLSEAVTFHGAKGNVEVRAMLGCTDVLVLPSYWDGWGAVVNEALCAGSRVICSDHCGAADLVATPRIGSVFAEGSVDSLGSALNSTLAGGRLAAPLRKEIYRYSANFGGPAVASYLLEVIRSLNDKGSPRPEPPWRAAAHEFRPAAEPR